MDKPSVDEIVKALRCSASVMTKDIDCSGCRYRTLEEVSADFPCPADVKIDDKEYWESCDTEQMAFDAADMLERLNEIPFYKKG